MCSNYCFWQRQSAINRPVITALMVISIIAAPWSRGLCPSTAPLPQKGHIPADLRAAPSRACLTVFDTHARAHTHKRGRVDVVDCLRTSQSWQVLDGRGTCCCLFVKQTALFFLRDQQREQRVLQRKWEQKCILGNFYFSACCWSLGHRILQNK